RLFRSDAPSGVLELTRDQFEPILDCRHHYPPGGAGPYRKQYSLFRFLTILETTRRWTALRFPLSRTLTLRRSTTIERQHVPRSVGAPMVGECGQRRVVPGHAVRARTGRCRSRAQEEPRHAQRVRVRCG